MSTQRKLYTSNQACDILQVSRPTLNDWASKGIIKKISVPGQRRVYIQGDSIDKLVEGKAAKK